MSKVGSLRQIAAPLPIGLCGEHAHAFDLARRDICLYEEHDRAFPIVVSPRCRAYRPRPSLLERDTPAS